MHSKTVREKEPFRSILFRSCTIKTQPINERSHTKTKTQIMEEIDRR